MTGALAVSLPARHPSRLACVDYVVAHELVHLEHPHHTPELWRRLERLLPDFEVRRKRLLEQGRQVSAI